MKTKITKLLYIGNILGSHGYNKTSVENVGPLLENEGFEVFYASSVKNIFFRLLDMIVKTIRFYKVDFVIIDTYSTLNFWYSFVVSQLCRLLKVKYITYCHGGNLPNRLKSNPKIAKLIFENAFLNLMPSNYLLQSFKSYQISNLKFIPNSIKINEYDFKLRENVGPKILWVRSLAQIYNPKMAVDVLEKLKTNFPSAELCMVGPENGVSITELKKYADSKKLTVNFTGKLSKEEWTKLSMEYDIFINTTHFDNTPISVIEALALGLPVVSTNVGGIPFLVKNDETAILINDSDVEGMVKAIENLINNPQLSQKLSLNGRKLVEQFDWEIVKNLWKEILK